jgi:hypothetical protein
MRSQGSDTYFDTQAAALQSVYDEIEAKQQYEIVYPEMIWTEHVAYGTTCKYHLPLKVKRTGNFAKKYLHIVLHRMDSGKYELTHYKS